MFLKFDGPGNEVGSMGWVDGLGRWAELLPLSVRMQRLAVQVQFQVGLYFKIKIYAL